MPGSPVITVQPADITVSLGKTARFSVTATGNGPLHYQWFKNGQNITGATKASYTTPATSTPDNGTVYSVTVSNAVGSVTSNGAILTVTSSMLPAITSQPASKLVRAGQTAKFSVVASGTAPLTYLWMKNGQNISGGNKSSYVTPPVTSADSGSIFSVLVSNSSGTVTSNGAVLTVK